MDSAALFRSELRFADMEKGALATLLSDGVLIEAMDLARGPWDRGALHGGPVSAILGFALEAQDVAGSFVVARLTVELERPVPPHQPLTLSAAVIRPGRKVQLAEAILRLDGKTVARARALFIRREGVEFPVTAAVVPEPAPVSGGTIQKPSMTTEYEAFHNVACEHRFVEGNWLDRGPVFVWVRLKVPVIAGVPVSPLQRVAAAADFGNGVSGVLPWDGYTFINPDLTVYQDRPLEGDWVGMRAKSHVGPEGVGFAESELFDRQGRMGRSVQSLLLEQRP